MDTFTSTTLFLTFYKKSPPRDKHPQSGHQSLRHFLTSPNLIFIILRQDNKKSDDLHSKIPPTHRLFIFDHCAKKQSYEQKIIKH